MAAVDEELQARFLVAMDRRGFSPATVVADGDHAVPDLILFRDASGRRIDVLYAHTDFERAALARRTTGEPYAGVEVPVISIEDLIVYNRSARLVGDPVEPRVRATRGAA